MTMLEPIKHLNFAVVILSTLLYLYRGLYIVVGLVRRRWQDWHRSSRLRHFAMIISARNEEGVIRELPESPNRQNYPKELLDLYVVADNCTDDAAEVAHRIGAFIYEHFDQVHRGKGYAVDYLLRRFKEEGKDCHDGYFVFDADNLANANFVAEMGRTLDQGYDAVTCYHNPKSFAANWIPAGHSIWSLREARSFNSPRTLLDTNCHVSGIGFLIPTRVIEDNGGWPFHLLIEDIQFSMNCAIQGKRIGYCDKVTVHDEQLTTSQQFWDQRLWWSKNSYQVDREYTLPPLRGCFRRGHLGTSCYDMFVTVAPSILLALLMTLFNSVILAACLTQPVYLVTYTIHETAGSMGPTVQNFYVGLSFYGLIMVLSKWRHIDAAPAQKSGYVPTFPIFMPAYTPTFITALVQKVEWKPIYHIVTKKINELG